MDSLPPTPAVVQMQEKCTENGQSWCRMSKTGYNIAIRVWQEDAPQLIERLNAIPIQSLTLANSAVADRHLCLLTNTQNLDYLCFMNMPLDGSGLDTLPECENVTQLILTGCMLHGRKLIGFRRFPNVRRLSFDIRSYPDDALSSVTPMKNLESLTVVTRECMTGVGLAGLNGCNHLWHLNLQDTTVSMGFEHLSRCERLTHINVINTEVDDDCLYNIAKIRSLKSLYVGSERTTNRGLRCFSGHPCLESLGYYGRGSGAEHIGITEDFFVDLVSIPSLTHLHVACKVTPNGLSVLRKLKKLESLDVDWPTVTQEELEFIRKQLPRCRVESRFLPHIHEPSEDD